VLVTDCPKHCNTGLKVLRFWKCCSALGSTAVEFEMWTWSFDAQCYTGWAKMQSVGGTPPSELCSLRHSLVSAPHTCNASLSQQSWVYSFLVYRLML
jgi:hypothetical protein